MNQITETQFKSLSADDKETYLKFKEEDLADIQAKKLLTYKPYKTQKDFHMSTKYIRGLFGGNRAGKSLAGLLEFLFHITGFYPEWYPIHGRMLQPLSGRIVVKDFGYATDKTITPMLKEWLPQKDVVRVRKNSFGVAVDYEMKNGSSFSIMTWEQDTEQFEGANIQICWFDEPVPRDKYIASLRGLIDRGGRAWLTLTPLTEPWIYDELYATDNPEVDSFTVDITDNPHISKKEVAKFASMLTEDEKEARLHGRFMHLSGLIYKEFKPEVHITKSFTLPDKEYTKYMAIDLHPRTPTAVLWLAINKAGDKYIYRELWLEGKTIKDIAKIILTEEEGEDISVRLLDYPASIDNELSGHFNAKSEFAKYGLYCLRATRDETLGIQRMKLALKPEFSNITKTFISEMRIFDDCRHWIYEIQHYMYKDYKRNPEQRNLQQKPRDKDNHFMDLTYYILLKEPGFNRTYDGTPEVTWSREGYIPKKSLSVSRESAYHNLIVR